MTIDVSLIDLAGFESALALMGQSVMRSEAEALYDKFDADGNGMDEDEWIAFYANEILRPIDEDQVLDVFHDLWYAHARACICMCLHACACRTGGVSLSLPNTTCLPAPAPFFAPLPPCVSQDDPLARALRPTPRRAISSSRLGWGCSRLSRSVELRRNARRAQGACARAGAWARGGVVVGWFQGWWPDARGQP